MQILDLLIDYALLDYGEAIDTICRDLGARRYINSLHPGTGLAVRAPVLPSAAVRCTAPGPGSLCVYESQAIHVAAKKGNSNAFNALILNGADLYLKSQVRASLCVYVCTFVFCTRCLREICAPACHETLTHENAHSNTHLLARKGR